MDTKVLGQVLAEDSNTTVQDPAFLFSNFSVSCYLNQ